MRLAAGDIRHKSTKCVSDHFWNPDAWNSPGLMLLGGDSDVFRRWLADGCAQIGAIETKLSQNQVQKKSRGWPDIEATGLSTVGSEDPTWVSQSKLSHNNGTTQKTEAFHDSGLVWTWNQGISLVGDKILGRKDEVVICGFSAAAVR